MPLDDTLLEAEEKMAKTEEVVLKEFAGVRTGKASPGLVENIMVEVYGGSQMRIRELAGITTPESRVITITPWDKSTLQAIEKAIQKANLGLNPTVQGKFIRIVLPELSGERRQEFLQTVVRSEVASAYARVEAVQKSLTMFDQGVISRSNDNIRAIRAAYQLGEFKITDLLTEQRRLLDSQKEFTEALAERYRALADLRTAIGSPLTGNER